MQNKTVTNIDRIIAKIDNDFNPDNSDWIPRVGAWCIDAMSMIDCLATKRVKQKVPVKDRIAYIGCPINDVDIKIYDKCNRLIKELNGCDCLSTGDEQSSSTTEVTNTISIHNTDSPVGRAPDYLIAETINDKSWPGRYNVHEVNYKDKNIIPNYVITNNNQIELNFDTDYIIVETNVIETTKNEFGYEVPVIPNNGMLIEALTYYCMYKMLCRGYKHPVFNLNASQYGTNPYYEWNKLKDEARRSVINNQFDSDENITKILRSNFYINTFDTRR